MTLGRTLLVIASVGILCLVSFLIFSLFRPSFTINQEDRAIMSAKPENYFGSTEPFWQPSLVQIQECESHLTEYFQKIDADRSFFEPGAFRMQYIGSGDTKTRIEMNAFCKEAFTEFPLWKTQWVTVLDGGSCFFQATCDLQMHDVTSVTFNGSP